LKEKIVGRPKETAGVKKKLNWMDVAVRKVCSPIATQANHFPFNCNCALTGREKRKPHNQNSELLMLSDIS
jgi:hypothetical protein